MPAHSDASRVDRHLGDFTLTPRVLIIVAVALPIGALGAVAAAMLAPIYAINPWSGMPILLKGFVSVILGGLGLMCYLSKHV